MKIHSEHEKAEMIKIAKAHQKEMDEEVRYGDKNHHIKTITYEWDKIQKNPMGGFIVYGYVNDDKKLNIAIIVDKVNGKIECRLASSAPAIGKWEGMDK